MQINHITNRIPERWGDILANFRRDDAKDGDLDDSNYSSANLDERTIGMLELFSTKDFNNLRIKQQVRFSVVSWILRNKVIASLKRGLDLFLCLLILPIVAPIMLVTAIAVKIDSPGPVFFRQERVGKWGKPFICYKFRSMFIDAEARKAELMHLNEADSIVFKIAKDPRITRVGHITRKLSIDELPQVLNVMRGDMSWVGPRPPIPFEVAHYKYDHYRRLNATPGITGLQQVSGRSDVSFDRWIELDLQYIQEQSFLKDIEILIKTVPAVITGKGAY